MVREDEGWWVLTTATARPGSRYRYVVDGSAFPDPASRRQPEGVHGPSEVVDPEAYEWNDLDWRGRRWEEIVLYELHLGTFSETGDFDGAMRHLDHLCRLGATAVELMPIAEFPGERNWGYDGVFPYAPSSRYGRPEELKRLVEACHLRGLAILLDVVYNHFGPEGNYLPAIAPDFFTERHQTPWGAAIDFSGPQSRPVRDFFIHNALYWLEEFQFDGLRLDAVHAIFDDSRPDIVDEIGETVRQAHPGSRNSPGPRKRPQRGAPSSAAKRADRALQRPMERRSAPCFARVDHRRDRRVLWRLRDCAGGTPWPRFGRGVCLSGRAVAISRRQAPRRTLRRNAARPLSSPFCRTTIRSATIHSGRGSLLK